jgi:23S rRNA pseudouridine1911/1915/1917 synthase
VGSTTSITVLHEDKDFIVINKPPVLDSQASRPDRPSVARWIEDRCGFSGLVHRLDFNTSGVMILAKTPAAAARATKALQEGKIERSYQAIALGRMKEDQGTINRPIEGKECETHFKVLERFANATVLELKLGTGRKHQIRRHLSEEGHPLLGELLYKRKGSDRLHDRPALHSWRLVWDALKVEAPLPEDLLKLAQRLRKNQAEFSS